MFETSSFRASAASCIATRGLSVFGKHIPGKKISTVAGKATCVAQKTEYSLSENCRPYRRAPGGVLSEWDWLLHDWTLQRRRIAPVGLARHHIVDVPYSSDFQPRNAERCFVAGILSHTHAKRRAIRFRSRKESEPTFPDRVAETQNPLGRALLDCLCSLVCHIGSGLFGVYVFPRFRPTPCREFQWVG